jgi:hypothetical protein
MTASHIFRDLMPRLADRFRLIAPDLPDFPDYGGVEPRAVVSTHRRADHFKEGIMSVPETVSSKSQIRPWGA